MIQLLEHFTYKKLIRLCRNSFLCSGRNFRRIQQRTARYDNQCNLPVCAVIHYKRYQYLCIGILYSAEQRSCFRYNFIFENAGFSGRIYLYSSVITWPQRNLACRCRRRNLLADYKRIILCDKQKKI